MACAFPSEALSQLGLEMKQFTEPAGVIIRIDSDIIGRFFSWSRFTSWA